MGFCQVPKIQIGSKNTEQGQIQIYGKNADAIILGDATHEGGNISVYRDTSGNKQLFVDADAASNALAMSVYGGVVAQNYLTVGQTSLSTTHALVIVGSASISGVLLGNICVSDNDFRAPTDCGLRSRTDNQATLIAGNIIVTNTDSTTHTIKQQIDGNDMIVLQATGNGSGGIDAATKAIGLYGAEPATQHAAIADATDAATAITQLNLLLVANRAIGLIAT